MAENEEDILKRLEELRTKVSEEEGEKKPPTPSRRRRNIIVGILVIILISGISTFAVYNFLYKPMQEKKKLEEKKKLAQIEKLKQQLLQAKNIRKKQVEDAFSGLPPEYSKKKYELLDKIEKATSIEEVAKINPIIYAKEAWKSYIIDQLEKYNRSEDIMLKTANYSIKGYSEIVKEIDRLPLSELKTAKIEIIRKVYLPIEVEGAIFIKPGAIVDIYYVEEENNIEALAKNCKVVSVAISKESVSIALSESERKVVGGEGGEGKGTISSISAGGIGTITGVFPATAGYKMQYAESSYNVNIWEIIKATAAGKIPEDYIDITVGDYAEKLNELIRKTGIADFKLKYLILLEVSEDEALKIIPKAIDDKKRKKMYLTFVKLNWKGE